LRGGTTLVPLLLLGYSVVTQLLPALLASLAERPRIGAAGAAAGIVTGVAVVTAVSLSGTTLAKLLPGAPGWLTEVNVGIVALALNTAVMFAVGAIRRPH
jgi:SSS family solute:Na+ symporter